MKTTHSIFLIVLLSLAFTGYGQTAKQYFDLGLAKEERGEYRDAIIYYSKAIEIDPKYAEAYSGRGYSKGELKDYIGSIADYNKAITIVPKTIAEFSGSYSGRGYAKYNLKDYRGAIDDYTMAIVINSKYGMAYYFRGLAKLKIGQKTSGCLDFSKAGELGVVEAYEEIKKFCN